MHRRDVLRLALALPAGAMVGLAVKRAHAQFGDVTNEMFFKRPWQDQNVFSELRILSRALIRLRVIYSGPLGYEAEPRFRDNVFDVWSSAMGPNSAEGWKRTIGEVQPKLDAGLADSLKSDMDSLLERNGDKLVGWLGEVGVRPNSQLQVDLLRGQALFAINASVLLGDGKPSFFSDFTWIYPFC
jgi:hypothetical protein